MRISLELHAHMERAWLLLLGYELLLVPIIGAKWVLGVAMIFQPLVSLIIEPLSICLVLQQGQLVVLRPLESLVDLVKALHVGIAHGQAFDFSLSFVLVYSDTFFVLHLRDKFINLLILVNNFLE